MGFLDFLKKKQCPKTKPFVADKAEWQWDSALEFYCEDTGVEPDAVQEEHEDQIWERAGNHIAFFLTWLIRHDGLSSWHCQEDGDDIQAVKQKEMTGADFLANNCDMVLSREDIAKKFLSFVDAYYESRYMDDYTDFMGDNTLSATFSWEDYERFEPVLNRVYEAYCKK